MAFKDLRKKADLSQQELANKAQISLITVGRYERGERKPTLDNAVKLAVALGCTVDEIVNEYIQSA